MEYYNPIVLALILTLAHSSTQQVNLAGVVCNDAAASHWIVGGLSYGTDDEPSEVSCPGKKIIVQIFPDMRCHFVRQGSFN